MDAGPRDYEVPHEPLTNVRLTELTSKGDATAANVQIDILRKQWERADATFAPAQELKKIAK